MIYISLLMHMYIRRLSMMVLVQKIASYKSQNVQCPLVVQEIFLSSHQPLKANKSFYLLPLMLWRCPHLFAKLASQPLVYHNRHEE